MGTLLLHISIESSHSDDVTSGKSNKLRNIYIHKNVEKLDKKYSE